MTYAATAAGLVVLLVVVAAQHLHGRADVSAMRRRFGATRPRRVGVVVLVVVDVSAGRVGGQVVTCADASDTSIRDPRLSVRRAVRSAKVPEV